MLKSGDVAAGIEDSMWIKALFIELEELMARWFTPEVELLPQGGWCILDTAIAVLVAYLRA
jgi:hypothetical protein